MSRSNAKPEMKFARIAPPILILAHLLKRSGDTIYEAELGLSSIGWRIIARLGDQGPMTHTELVELAQFDKGQLSRTVAQLVELGLISRKPRDWRTIELRLTSKGRKVSAALDKISLARHETLRNGIGDLELRQFMTTLEKIMGNARQMLVK
jgi:DNA-binding MarR family transcriptional regulator